MQAKTPAPVGRLGDVDLRLLRVFKAVADCGGMAAAELELNIAMSTISRHVKDLEQRLGLVLCRRGRGGFALTPEGERDIERNQCLPERLQPDDVARMVLHQHPGGDLHVALFEKTASNPAAHVDRAIGLFRERAPAVQLHLHVGTIGMIERGVIDGQVHLGLIPEHRRSASLHYAALFDETMRLYAGAGHPWFAGSDAKRGWDALRAMPLAGLGYHSPNQELMHARRLERAATASDQEGVALLVLSGAYLGFLPDHYAEPFVRAGRLRAVAPGLLQYRCRFWCIRRRGPAPLRIAQAFHDCLLQAHR